MGTFPIEWRQLIRQAYTPVGLTRLFKQDMEEIVDGQQQRGTFDHILTDLNCLTFSVEVFTESGDSQF